MPKIQVRLQELVPAFHNGGRAQFYLDRETGQVLMDFEGCMYDERGDDIRQALLEQPSRFTEIESIGRRETTKMMQEFINTCVTGDIRRELESALASPRPFQNFRNVVSDNFECKREWLKFEEEYTERLASQWLTEHEVDAELLIPDPAERQEAPAE